MRLLNVLNGHIEEFNGNQMPRYACLSHTWEKDELSFADMPSNPDPVPTKESDFFSLDSETWQARFSAKHDLDVQGKQGYLKVNRICEEAFRQHIGYVWVDTTCIDKSSSAELSEAINSMFQWYKNASICYTFLEDVSREDPGAFALSRWFRRGWTLQELLAPQRVSFYTKEWQYIGNKISLIDQLVSATGIDKATILDPTEIPRNSVAQRMSWASNRQTKRPEDTAYCLMGIFGVSMPLIYGEGDRAFQRLQEEIIKISHDQSIFAWNLFDEPSTLHGPAQFDFQSTDLLAPSPAYFAKSGKVVPITSNIHNSSYSMTNRGLLLDIPILEGPFENMLSIELQADVRIGVLACRSTECAWNTCLGIPLWKPQESSDYLRVRATAGWGSISCRLSKNDKSTSVNILRGRSERDALRSLFTWSLNYKALYDRHHRLVYWDLPSCSGFSGSEAVRQNLTVHSNYLRKDSYYVCLVFWNASIRQAFAVRCEVSRTGPNRAEVTETQYIEHGIDDTNWAEWSRNLSFVSMQPKSSHTGMHYMDHRKLQSDLHLWLDWSRQCFLGQSIEVIDLLDSRPSFKETFNEYSLSLQKPNIGHPTFPHSDQTPSWQQSRGQYYPQNDVLSQPRLPPPPPPPPQPYDEAQRISEAIRARDKLVERLRRERNEDIYSSRVQRRNSFSQPQGYQRPSKQYSRATSNLSTTAKSREPKQAHSRPTEHVSHRQALPIKTGRNKFEFDDRDRTSRTAFSKSAFAEKVEEWKIDDTSSSVDSSDDSETSIQPIMDKKNHRRKSARRRHRRDYSSSSLSDTVSNLGLSSDESYSHRKIKRRPPKVPAPPILNRKNNRAKSGPSKRYHEESNRRDQPIIVHIHNSTPMATEQKSRAGGTRRTSSRPDHSTWHSREPENTDIIIEPQHDVEEVD